MQRKGKLLNASAGFVVSASGGFDGDCWATRDHSRSETVGYPALDPRSGSAAVSRKPAIRKQIDGVRFGRLTRFDQLLHDGHQRERSMLRSERTGMEAVNGVTCYRPARTVVVSRGNIPEHDTRSRCC